MRYTQGSRQQQKETERESEIEHENRSILGLEREEQL